MENNDALRKWSTLRGLPVTIPSEGRTVGTVEDFYFKPGTNAVYALRVHTRLLGDLALPTSGISTIGQEAITIASEQMLLRALPPLPTGQGLLSSKIVSENGTVVGTIGDVLLGVNPLVALRVSAFAVASSTGKGISHPKSFTADAVTHYGDGVITISDYTARRLG